MGGRKVGKEGGGGGGGEGWEWGEGTHFQALQSFGHCHWSRLTCTVESDPSVI